MQFKILIKYIMNLFSRLYRTSSKAGLIVTSVLHEIIIGKMLGDLHAERPSIKHNTRLSFKQSIVQDEYISHLWKLFSVYCTSPPITRSYPESRTNKAPFTKVSRFNTCNREPTLRLAPGYPRFRYFIISTS